LAFAARLKRLRKKARIGPKNPEKLTAGAEARDDSMAYGTTEVVP